MTPEQRAVWQNHITTLRSIQDYAAANKGSLGVSFPGYVEVAVADHVVALEAQVAEARRLFEQYGWNGAPDGYCIACYEESVHLADCPVGAFLAATAGME